ncbi:hypothetical protein RvY_18053 [Ramazzottius varieornatus]|uniref:Reverse transcriptase RNase H-like domain-containing protein n=1 Tax=Ramazzottius varieornatus TaxID=947166 RepID=A0A1D1W680_RAMVA|nr:hypothetical protein RvY_18053 [Ramazzottius varieornatus]
MLETASLIDPSRIRDFSSETQKEDLRIQEEITNIARELKEAKVVPLAPQIPSWSGLGGSEVQRSLRQKLDESPHISVTQYMQTMDQSRVKAFMKLLAEEPTKHHYMPLLPPRVSTEELTGFSQVPIVIEEFQNSPEIRAYRQKQIRIVDFQEKCEEGYVATEIERMIIRGLLEEIYPQISMHEEENALARLRFRLRTDKPMQDTFLEYLDMGKKNYHSLKNKLQKEDSIQEESAPVVTAVQSTITVTVGQGTQDVIMRIPATVVSTPTLLLIRRPRRKMALEQSMLRYCADGNLNQTINVVTDHVAVTYLKNIKDPNGRLARWAMFLSQYDIVCTHLKGKLMAYVDALSKYPMEDADSESAESVVFPQFAQTIRG